MNYVFIVNIRTESILNLEGGQSKRIQAINLKQCLRYAYGIRRARVKMNNAVVFLRMFVDAYGQ